jgi:hypothetical protein
VNNSGEDCPMRVKYFTQHQPIGIRMSVFCHRSIPVYFIGQSSRNGSNARDRPWKKELKRADIDPHRYSWFGCHLICEVDDINQAVMSSGHDWWLVLIAVVTECMVFYPMAIR